MKLTPANRRALFLILLLLTTGGFSFLALVLPASASENRSGLTVGSVATRDYLAPYPLTYESQVLTQQQRDKQAAAVASIYTPADPAIARAQLDHLRAALAYITSVRDDEFSSQAQKLEDLGKLQDIQLGTDTATSILNLSNTRWQAVRDESIAVLEQVMRSTIRTDRLEDARRSVPSLISLSMPDDQARLVTVLVSGFMVPNSLYNQGATDAARQQARLSVAPIMRSYMTGETIVQRGQVISESDLEALAEYGLSQPQFRWQDMAGAAALALLIIGFLVIYLRHSPLLATDPEGMRGLVLLAMLFLFYLATARLIIPGHTVIPYLFPLTSYSLLVSTLFGAEPALVSSLALAVMVTFGLPYSLELTLYFVLSSFFSILALGRGKRITAFFWTALVTAASGIAVILAYRLPQPSTDWLGLATLAVAAIGNGIASASITLLLQFFLAQFLGKTTALQLMELSRPDHPLLQELLRTAPGTYQHSLQVANLAEQAAERIGADAMLTRVGALYHDIGKTENPIFFIENQVPGNLNPHDDLDPEVSAAMIIRHVKYGALLARRYHLPRRLQDFIFEHHGQLTTRYQYCQAIESVGGDKDLVNESQFRYPGPKPQSRETALLMLADGCEARVRAEIPKNEDALRKIIQSVIAGRLNEGALDDTDLTLHDLKAIEESFTATLRGVYHPRIQYPQITVSSEQASPPEELPAGETNALPEPFPTSEDLSGNNGAREPTVPSHPGAAPIPSTEKPGEVEDNQGAPERPGPDVAGFYSTSGVK